MSFSRYTIDDSVISSEAVVTGLWSNGTNTLNTFFTSSTNTGSGYEYYVNVYNTGSALSGSSTQFSIQYAHVNGSGSAYLNAGVPGISPSRIIYGEYRNLVYGDENTNFVFSGSATADQDFFVLNFARSRYKESLYPGSLLLCLSGSSGKLWLTDNSTVVTSTNFLGENRYFNLVNTASLSGTSYGYVFPDLNVILINPDIVGSGYITTPSRTANTNTSSSLLLFNSIKLGANCQLKSQETVSSRYFFTRVKNNEFNYTTNPSVINTSGSLLYDTLIDNPQTYVTTVGMYNDNNELLAVAKLSRPLQKDFTKELLVRVKLDF